MGSIHDTIDVSDSDTDIDSEQQKYVIYNLLSRMLQYVC